jgi:hypothetical protein
MTPQSGRALLEYCLHEDVGRLTSIGLPPAESNVWDDLSGLAARQRVRPLLYRAVKRGGLEAQVPPRLWDNLAVAYRNTALRNLRLCGELAQVARALAARDVPVLVLKGAYLAGEIYRDVGLREMNDLDILVRVEDLPTAVDVLRERDYRPLYAFTIKSDVSSAHHLTPFVKRDAAAIEIHWSITPPHTRHAIDPAELWRRAVSLIIAGVPMRGLCPVDLLLHLCFHASFQHQFQFGLRPFCDIAATVDRCGTGIDWEIVVRQTRDWHWTRGVYLALRLAHDLVGARVPADVFRTLTPADFDHELLETASTQIFDPPVSPTVAQLVVEKRVATRLGRLARYAFGQRRPTAAHPTDWLRRGRTAARLLLNNDPALTASAERTNRLLTWMSA